MGIDKLISATAVFMLLSSSVGQLHKLLFSVPEVGGILILRFDLFLLSVSVGFSGTAHTRPDL